MKMAYWDLETHDLSPSFGPLICASVLLLPSEEMITFRMDTYIKRKLATDMTDDRQLCIDLRDLLEDQHITCGYFSKGFDITHLRTRLAMHGERILEKMLHMDPIWYFKGWRGLRTMSSKMKHVAAFLHAAGQDIELKPDVLPETWMIARQGNKKALDEVCDRCESDVRITRIINEYTMDKNQRTVANISKY